jgi:hypothetical protein
VIAGAVAIALLVASNGYLFWQLKNVRGEVGDLSSNFAAEMNEIDTARETSAVESGKTRQELEDLRQQLSSTIKTAETSVGRARVDARKHAEKLAQDLAAKQEEQRNQIAERISEIEAEASSKIEQVSTDVGSVKSEVASNKQELETVVSDFKMVRGDLGVMSGRIATNADELAALKALGERNYFEFEVVKSKTPTRVGDIQMTLRHTEWKNNRFAIDILADDKRIEKKFKTVNEPIQFYMGGRGGQPYEIVVNEVRKDRIVGYLATPKTQMARR